MPLATRRPQLVAFDLDDTLAPSKQPVPSAIATRLNQLLAAVPVCVISGGNTTQFRRQLLPALDLAPEQATQLHLMPTCGTRYLRFDGQEFSEVYAHDLPEPTRQEVIALLEATAREIGVWESETWGPAIEDRGSQITYSALGQKAPVEAKQAWDPTGTKRESLRAAMAAKLPDLEVRAGGSTSVDITAKGIDKAYGMRELAKVTGIALSDMIFIGDRLAPGGNDYPVAELGVPTIAVANWEQTPYVLDELLAAVARPQAR